MPQDQNTITRHVKVEQYRCPSYYDDHNVLQNCLCGKCDDVKSPSKTFSLEVDYDDSQWKTIDESRYSYVNDMTVDDFPIEQTGKQTVYFQELKFDHDPTDDEVLAEMERKDCRQPNRAEVETAIQRYTSEQLGAHSRVGLVGPAVLRSGGLSRACVIGRGRGVSLRWDWAEDRWRRYCRFVAVCKSNSNTRTLSPSETLTLESLDERVKKLEEFYKNIKEL